MLNMLKRFVIADHVELAWYRWPTDGRTFALDPEIQLYSRENPMPDHVADDMARMMGAWALRVFKWRTARGHSRVYVFPAERGAASYAWVSDMCLYRKYFKIAGPGWMLGPYATREDHRRKGLYARLLRHTLTHLAGIDNRVRWAFADVDNVVPRRAMEELGFEPLGVYETHTAFFRLIARSKLISNKPARLT